MIILTKHEPGAGLLVGATDDNGHGVVNLLKDGFKAEYIADEVIAKELIDLPAEEFGFEHALAITYDDVINELVGIFENIDTEGGDVARWIISHVKRKIYFALLDWGDGVNPGEVLLYNYAGKHVNIKYEEVKKND